MAASNEVAEGSFSNLLVNSLEANRSGDALSPEDVAWVDSCLVRDPEISDGEWSSLKDVLLEILCLQPESDKASAPVSDVIPGGSDTDMVPSGEVGEMDYDTNPMDEETGTANADVNEESSPLLSQVFEIDPSKASLRSAFLLSYNEDDETVNISQDGVLVDIGFASHEQEPSPEDIFKVWDLDIPAEEDELVKQLNKALSGSSVPLMSSKVNDSGALGDLKEESVDDIIAGMEDLSLNRHSS